MLLQRFIVLSMRLRSYLPPGNVGPGYLPSRLALSNAVGERPVRAAACVLLKPRGAISSIARLRRRRDETGEATLDGTFGDHSAASHTSKLAKRIAAVFKVRVIDGNLHHIIKRLVIGLDETALTLQAIQSAKARPSPHIRALDRLGSAAVADSARLASAVRKPAGEREFVRHLNHPR